MAVAGGTGTVGRHIVAVAVRLNDPRNDLIERHRRSIDDFRPRRAIRQQTLRNERTCIKANRAASDQIASAHRDEVGRSGTRANEMNCHFGRFPASTDRAAATVTFPMMRLGMTSCEPGPAANSAAASAIELMP